MIDEYCGMRFRLDKPRFSTVKGVDSALER
jgi:hypothetical protein